MPEFITLTAMFAVGTTFFYAFWGIVVFLTLVEAALVESENWGFAFVITAIAAGILGNQLHAVAAIKADPWLLGRYLIYYVMAGILCIFGKWVVFTKKHRRQAESLLKAFKDGRNIKDRLLTEEEIAEALRYNSELKTAPQVKDHKARLVNWGYLWPFCLVGTICGDWLREIFVWLYNGLGRVLDRVAKAVWGGALKA